MRMSKKAQAALASAFTFYGQARTELDQPNPDMDRFDMYERWANEELANAGLPDLRALRSAFHSETMRKLSA